MSQVSQSEAAASGGSPRGNKDGASAQATEERFTTLRSREEYTFSQMRIDRGGPVRELDEDRLEREPEHAENGAQRSGEIRAIARGRLATAS